MKIEEQKKLYVKQWTICDCLLYVCMCEYMYEFESYLAPVHCKSCSRFVMHSRQRKERETFLLQFARRVFLDFFVSTKFH